MTSSLTRRVILAAAGATALVAGAFVLPSSGPGADVSFGYAAQVRDPVTRAQLLAKVGALPHVDGVSTHNHNDPATKNAISRAADHSTATLDPTTAEQARANAAYAAADRTTADPQLTHVRLRDPRRAVPQNRYVMAEGCYQLAGRPIFFQATDLGRYLLYTKARTFVAPSGLATSPSADTVWTVTGSAGSFRFRNGGGYLMPTNDGFSTSSQPTSLSLRLTTGCTRYPEVQTNVVGGPTAGVSSFQEVRGYVDPHVHGMAFEFLGGDAHCGRPWHEFGAPSALVDCPDHIASGGCGGVLEDVLSGQPCHDPVGWPTFKDWPAPESLTHEGVYHKWLERSWRGGQRIFTNLLVENDQLCKLYPIKHNSCDDMDSLRLQAKDMYKLQDYIDAQYGGPGKGWYRIVTNPFQARKVINEGKLAVIMGIETSIPFGCTMKLDIPACDVQQIDAGLDEMRRLGVRQMELVNKFDNALSGVAGDEGAVGVAVNGANFMETGSFWDMQHCEPADGETHDKTQLALPDISAGQQDALFGAVASLGLPNLAVPIYPPAPHCNSRGLTPLGAHLINSMVKRHMLFDPDHMSVKARKASLTQLEKLHYAGVISSHSWSTPDAYPRIYKLGGFIAPYAGDSTGFFAKWQKHLTWSDKRFYWGIGYGADMNGLGAQGSPRGASVSNPVTYPFTGLGGVRIGKEHSGQRVYDINVDGVAHYGLYPDWIQDLVKVGGATDGPRIQHDLARGAEAYLQMWERAQGIKADPCRNPGLRKSVSTFRSLVTAGMGTRQVMFAVGQPYSRLGTTFGYCARTATDSNVWMRVTFSPAGKVIGVTRL
jgi:hypothetical protein